MNIYEQINRNRRSTLVFVVIFVAFFAFIGLGVDYYSGAGIKMPIFSVMAFGVAGIASFSSFRYGDRLVLASTRAKELDLSDPKQQQWQNIVGEMAIASGLPMPKTYVIDDPDPNAFATGMDPDHASMAVTRGLLDALNREEMQAVCAHEMSHIRNYDIRLMLMVSVLVGSIALLADWGARGVFRSRNRSGSSGSGGSSGQSAAPVIFIIWLVAVILAPLLSQMVAMCVSRRREYLADASGAELTRNPLALASALEKINAHTEPTRSINRGTAHLCIADPVGSNINAKEGRLADLFATHPPIHKRIEALKQMAYLKA